MTPTPAQPRPAAPAPYGPRPAAPRRTAFTLVELLTVIAIIVILIAILLPTVGKVKVQANQAHTLQQINSIQTALDLYKTEQGAYPGALPNSAFGTNGLATLAGTSTGMVTMTEAAYLALWGGLEPTNPTGTATPGKYDPAYVGNGPMTFTVNLNRRVRRQAFMDPAPGNLTPAKASGNDWAGNGITGASDSNVPEFIDRFQSPRPIIYLRANVGAPGAMTDGTMPYPPSASSFQYDARWLTPYLRTNSDASKSDFGSQFKTDYPNKTLPNGQTTGTAQAGYQSYFTTPSAYGTPRGQNAYILISAGADGIFGTKDDLIYP